MDVPTWALIGFAGLFVVIAAMSIRHFVAMARSAREHPERLNDEWDPFA